MKDISIIDGFGKGYQNEGRYFGGGIWNKNFGRVAFKAEADD